MFGVGIRVKESWDLGLERIGVGVGISVRGGLVLKFGLRRKRVEIRVRMG